jgi:hypothetical protein
MKKFILKRLREASTWRGIMALITATGIALNPEQIEALIIVGMGVMGALGAFFPDQS